jgi:hypothetical protein
MNETGSLPHARPGFWWIRWVGIGAGFVAATMAAGYVLSSSPERFHGEGGPVESMQVALWALAAAIALVGVIVKRGSRDRWWIGWLGVIAALCAARELDLHILANPQHAGEWGVRYRLDWWMSATAPVGARLLWCGVFVGLALLLAVPPLRAKITPEAAVRALRRGDPGLWLTAIAFACLGAGWFADDILRPIRVVHTIIQGAEEALELCGAEAYLGAVILTVRSSLDARPGLGGGGGATL